MCVDINNIFIIGDYNEARTYLSGLATSSKNESNRKTSINVPALMKHNAKDFQGSENNLGCQHADKNLLGNYKILFVNNFEYLFFFQLKDNNLINFKIKATIHLLKKKI